MNKFLSITLLFLLTLVSNAQSVNDYKYLIIPKQFDWTSQPNQHRVNDLTRYLFKNAGFNVFYSDELLPSDINRGKCNALYAAVNDRSNFIWTRVTIELKDCEGAIIFTSEEGATKEKDVKKGYHEAIREAFISVEALGYAYKAPSGNTAVEEDNGSNNSVGNASTSDTVSNGDDATTPTYQQRYGSSTTSYNVKLRDDAYLIFDGEEQIGTAKKVTGDTFFVKTSHFEGVGILSENSFTISYEIKGQGDLKEIVLKAY